MSVDHRYGPIAMSVSRDFHAGRWPWLSMRAYALLLDTAMEADALEHDPLGEEAKP